MKWRKLGRIYVPDGRQAWAQTHAMLPTPFVISDEIIRLYIAQLDDRSVGRIGYLDVALSDPTRLVRAGEHPILDIGEPGTFDDNGVVPSCVVREGGRLLLYYYGFQLQSKIPYTIFTGLATSDVVDGPFRRVSRVPILDRTDEELYMRGAPFVLQDGGRWRMWYVGGSGWTHDGNGKVIPLYSMWHIQSDDGISWSNPSIECLVPRGPEEVGFGRPFVVRQGAKYRMWYSFRTRSTYRPGYAESTDGLVWTRKDNEINIDLSSTGWDSEMICFMAILRANDKWIMFYNGNGYGRTGVGVAVANCD